jgi:alkanesulfonate monooxygenase SsuD/methylene tetrahydromethanopterin reductase-like flavin-dependent oxidoreductase (luciferase family)
VLEGIAPGRIDLGVGRAPGSDRLTAYALNPHSNAADEFPQRVLDLQAWGRADHCPATILSSDQGASARIHHPELWILGRITERSLLLLVCRMRSISSAMAEVSSRRWSCIVRHRPALATRAEATICVWALAADTEAGRDGCS